MNQPINQPINQSINQSTSQPANQSTNQSTNQSINQSINQPTNPSINQSTNQSTNQPTNQSTNQSINQSINQSSMDRSITHYPKTFELWIQIDITNPLDHTYYKSKFVELHSVVKSGTHWLYLSNNKVSAMIDRSPTFFPESPIGPWTPLSPRGPYNRKTK